MSMSRKQVWGMGAAIVVALLIWGIHESSTSSIPTNAAGPIGGTGTSTTTSTTSSANYITAAQASGHVGQFETVRFTVGYTFTDSAGTEFLDQFQAYSTGFVVCIYSSDLGTFSVDPVTVYMGSTIDVTGMITTYNGYVEILNPNAITKVT